MTRTDLLKAAVFQALEEHRDWLDTNPIRSVQFTIKVQAETGMPRATLFSPECESIFDKARSNLIET